MKQRWKQTLAAFLSTLLLAGMAFPAGGIASAAAESEPFRITCVGSSTTEGVGSSNNALYSYPAQMQQMLGSDYAVTNSGVSGSWVTTGVGSFEYVSTDRYQQSLESKPDMVLMFVGSNDAVYSAWNRTDIDFPAKFRESYIKLMETYRNLDSHPVVVVCYPYRTFGHTEGRDDLVPNAVIPMLDEIAAEYGCPVLDLFTPTSEFGEDWPTLMPDGLHPSDAGYTIIAEAAAAFVKGYTTAGLSGITVDGEVLTDFSDDLYHYGVLLEEGAAIPTVAATAKNEGVQIDIKQASGALPATAEIEATSADGKISFEYTVTFSTDPADIAGQKAAAQIAAIGEVTLDKAEAIAAARQAVDALTAGQLAYVTNQSVLTTAEAKLAALQADAAAAGEVESAIRAIRPVTGAEQAEDIGAARAAYDALTDTQKAQVESLWWLEEAEAALIALDPAGYVSGLIDQILSNDYHYGKEIRAARAAYDLLTAQEAAGVENYSKLTAAETAVQAQYDAFTVTVSADGWRTSYANYPWMNKDAVSEEDRLSTAQAMADELKYEYMMEGYAIGRTTGSYSISSDWGDMVLFQADNESGSVATDNVGNPWGHGNRYWAMVSAPFAGTAFSQKGYFSFGGYTAPALGNAFSYNGRVYQIYWNGTRSHEDVALVKDQKVDMKQGFLFPGSDAGGTDHTANTFRYAYAMYSQQNKWEGKTLGIPSGGVQSGDDFTYQAFEGPDGYAYIAATAEAITAADSATGSFAGAYTITGAVAEMFRTLGTDDGARFTLTGCPTGAAEEKEGVLTQSFEKGVLTVYADGAGYFTSDDSDKALAASVDLQIDALGEITMAKEADVLAIRAAYDRLSAAQQALVIRAETLTAAEQTIAGIRAGFDLRAGDLDFDGKVTVSDVVELRRLIVAGQWTDAQFTAGNLDEDATLSVSDVVELRRLIVAGEAE
ncbi:MAG: GDSL-type esterase/lipase family protein [Candidatus Howiella sp.]